MRNLTKTLAVVSLLAPASGHSLGIGDIKLHSALNQNLNAEISLVLSPGEKVSDIKVNLASSDKFNEAGVPWVYFLSKIKFEPVTRSNGSVVIKVSSREALKEPVLDLLLEVSWPKGNLYREFTVLVDPPSVYEQATVPAWEASESYEVERYAPQQQTASRHSATEQSSAGSGRVTTGKNDTLWKIAEPASRDRNVSIEQMMIAIYKHNPRAFYKNNINALFAGKILKIPEREAVLKLSKKQALAEFNQQTEDWKNRLTAVPVEHTAASAKEESVDNQLTLVAPTDTAVAENAVVAPESEAGAVEKKPADQSVETPETTDASGISTGKEAASSAAPVDDEIKSKVAELEKQLAEMQKIIALKDQQLATLQNQPQPKSGPQEQVGQTPPVGEVVATEPVVPAKPVIQDQSVQKTPPPGEAPSAQAVDQAKPAIQKPVVKPVVRPVVKPQVPVEESSVFYYLGGAGGIALLGLLGWIWWRKNRGNEDEGMFASSSVNRAPGSAGEFSVPIIDDSIIQDTDAVGENFFLSDFSPSDFDIFDIDQGEIDPVSEADVYLAYGRYQQAEELMRDAIKDQPGRDECKLKLLEIFYSKADKQAFETYAGELAQAGKMDDPVFWEKVTEMGSEICPDAVLFSSGKGRHDAKNSSAFEGEVQLTKPHDIGSVGSAMDTKEVADDLATFDSSFRELFYDESVGETSESKDNFLDFDLDSLENEFVNKSQNNQSIDFDLGDFAADVKNSDEAQKDINIQKTESKDEFESFDFNFSSNDMEAKESSEIELGAVEETNEDYHQIDFSAEKTGELKDNVTDDLFSREFDFDFDAPVTRSVGQSSGKNSSFGIADLTEMDEMETKLDLAMAYIDMGDADAAKDIAKEILEKGTAEQKMIAQSLLDDLG